MIGIRMEEYYLVESVRRWEKVRQQGPLLNTSPFMGILGINNDDYG